MKTRSVRPRFKFPVSSFKFLDVSCSIRKKVPDLGIELLCSDLNGNETALAVLLDDAPLKVFAHNVETVERLTPNKFAEYERLALELGFRAAACGPLVRSSFQAGDLYRFATEKQFPHESLEFTRIRKSPIREYS